MKPRRWMVGLALGSALMLSGCRHCCKRPNCPPGPTGGPPGPTGTLPPQGIPLDPTPNTGMKSEVLLPSSPPPASSGFSPPTRGPVTLGDPDFNKSTNDEAKPLPKTVVPPVAKIDVPKSSFPVGIASFAKVKDNVFAGLRPDLEGLNWLHSNGYKTVVFLRGSTEDDSSDRKQVVVERGMKYESLVVAPDTINTTLVTEFNRLVNEAEGQPIFIYDVDGKRAGAMWYLHFRTSEMLKDDEARVKAGRFGVKEKSDDADQTQLWTALQKYLAEQKP